MIGIYRITNKINNKVYIGQSWDIKRRWIKRRWLDETKFVSVNKHLGSSFRKYGFDSFSFEILEELNENISQEELDLIETGKEYSSLNEAYRDTGVPCGNISAAILRDSKMAGGYHWKWL